MSPNTIADRAGQMQRMSDREREEAITASGAVGFGRFNTVRTQRALAQSYRQGVA